MSAKISRKHSRIHPLHLFAGLLATGLSVPALLGQSVPFPTYNPGENTSATTGPTYSQPFQPWVVSDGTIITPAGTQVNLGITDPRQGHRAQPHWQSHRRRPSNGRPCRPSTVFNTQTGAILQTYTPTAGTRFRRQHHRHHLYAGRQVPALQPGRQLRPLGSYVAIASVNATTGLLSDYAHVSVPMDVNATGSLTTVTCYPHNAAATPPRTALAGPRAALLSPAATPIRFSQMKH